MNGEYKQLHENLHSSVEIEKLTRKFQLIISTGDQMNYMRVTNRTEKITSLRTDKRKIMNLKFLKTVNVANYAYPDIIRR